MPRRRGEYALFFDDDTSAPQEDFEEFLGGKVSALASNQFALRGLATYNQEIVTAIEVVVTEGRSEATIAMTTFFPYRSERVFKSMLEHLGFRGVSQILAYPPGQEERDYAEELGFHLEDPQLGTYVYEIE